MRGDKSVKDEEALNGEMARLMLLTPPIGSYNTTQTPFNVQLEH